MRLSLPLSPLSRIAQANGSGRCPFHQGVVPLCFLLQSVVPALAGVLIVLNCSSRPFFNKTPEYMPKMQKTIQTIHHRAVPHIAKTTRFLSHFSITLSATAPLQLNIVLLAGIRFRTLTKETRVIQSHTRLPSPRRAPWRSTQLSGLTTGFGEGLGQN
jgi:hypothetical protein